MRWASSLSLTLDPDRAIEEGVQAIRDGLDGNPPDLIFLFPSGDHVGNAAGLAAGVRKAFPDAVLLGCTGAGVIGGGHEAEGTTAVAMTGGTLPDVRIHPFRLAPDSVPGQDVSPSVWRSVVGIDDPAGGWSFILLADPFTSRADELVQGLDYAYPGCVKIGGLASAAPAPGGNVLFLGDDTHSDGTVGVALSGDVRVDTVVAQGARPVGPDFDVTKCQRNVLFELDNRPALEVFQEVYEDASEDLPEDPPPAFFLGIRADDLDAEAGDFVIRNLLGIDPGAGAIAVGTVLRNGQSVRFHALSPETADADLREQLGGYDAHAAARGALLFSCNGRGKSLFGDPDHESTVFSDAFGGRVSLGGLFCAGEIGPIGATTHIHGFTSSFGILRPATGW
ncbi:MAG: hypothetical protein HKN12_08595 [Gemmatimonadetes bacterium]|nr:hypothetical protein [Gemmatimonadota bacterium]